MKPRFTITPIEKTEKAELVQKEYKGKITYIVDFNIRKTDASKFPFTRIESESKSFESEAAAREFFELKKNGEQAAEEAKTEEKKEAGMAKLSEKQIEALEKKGFRRWTKGDHDRLYIDAWNLPGIVTNWKKKGKKTITVEGEELSYGKSLDVTYAKIWIDLKTLEVNVDARIYEEFLKRAALSLLGEVLEADTSAAETPAEEKDIETMSAERAAEKAAFSTIALAESILKPFAGDANVRKNLAMLGTVKALIAGHAPNAKKLMKKLEDMDAFVGQARKIADVAAAKVAAAM